MKIPFLSTSQTFLQNWLHNFHRASLNGYKKIKITHCILSEKHWLRQDFNIRSPTKPGKRNNSLLNDYWIKAEIKKEKTSQNSRKINVQHTQSCGTQWSSSNRKLAALSAFIKKLLRSLYLVPSLTGLRLYDDSGVFNNLITVEG